LVPAAIAALRVYWILVETGVQTRNDAKFGKYTLVAKLATGGMGEIFLAKLMGMAGFEKLVVIKRLLPHLAEDSHFVTMLLDEARIAARLSHPNVCQVHDLGEVDGQYYIAMEYLEGVPCSQLLKRARRDDQHLDLGMACSILQQTCEGLHHAHELRDNAGKPIGLVHRDVSPSNLFATISGVIKVLDFGVAKSQDARARTHTGALKGKYAYMSPEQVLAHELDRRSDVFSMGIVFFELLTTRRLFWRDSEYKMFQAIAEEPIPDVRDFRSEVPVPLAAVVRRALSRDPDKRFASALDLATAIAKITSAMGETNSNRKISEYVAANFESAIRERRELLLTAVSAHDKPTVADGCADMGEHSHMVPEASGFADNPTPSDLSAVLENLKPGDLAPRRKISRLALLALLGLLVVGGVVFGVSLLRGAQADGSDEVGRQAPAPVDAVVSTAASELDEGEAPWGSDQVDAGRPQPVAPKRIGGGELYAAIAAAGGSRCTQSLRPDMPAFRIRLSITARGKATSIDVSPRSMRANKVARCLGRAARTARFPKNVGAYRGEVKFAVQKAK
jgi:serine/threonine-protein kinase